MQQRPQQHFFGQLQYGKPLQAIIILDIGVLKS
jgi:hypothetical protein